MGQKASRDDKRYPKIAEQALSHTGLPYSSPQFKSGQVLAYHKSKLLNLFAMAQRLLVNSPSEIPAPGTKHCTSTCEQKVLTQTTRGCERHRGTETWTCPSQRGGGNKTFICWNKTCGPIQCLTLSLSSFLLYSHALTGLHEQREHFLPGLQILCLISSYYCLHDHLWSGSIHNTIYLHLWERA